MVTALQSLRMQSSQFLLKALKETEQGAQSASSSTRSAILDRFGVSTSSSSSSQTTLSSLLASLSTSTDSTATTSVTTPVSTDVRTSSFMESLKDALETRSEEQGDAQSKAMLAALETGTLTVTDPAAGRTVTAWDTDDTKEKNTTAKAGTAIEKTGWSSFLQAHLTRGENATYSKTSDGSYIDATTGNSAYFGTIGLTYVYLTWPQGKTAS